MNTHSGCLPLVLLLCLAACQSATIESRQRTGYDFADLRTYHFLSPARAGVEGMSKDDLRISRGIAGVVRKEFEAMGYAQDDREPDFLVFVGATSRSAVRKGGWRLRGPSRASGTRGDDFGRYEEGVIALMAYDTKSGDEIFHVWARDALKESDPVTEEGVIEVVKEMMAKWPVKGAGGGR
jgi:hypothetical protein